MEIVYDSLLNRVFLFSYLSPGCSTRRRTNGVAIVGDRDSGRFCRCVPRDVTVGYRRSLSLSFFALPDLDQGGLLVASVQQSVSFSRCNRPRTMILHIFSEILQYSWDYLN